MYIPEFWVGVGACLLAEVVALVIIAAISAAKGNIQTIVKEEDEK